MSWDIIFDRPLQMFVSLVYIFCHVASSLLRFLSIDPCGLKQTRRLEKPLQCTALEIMAAK